MDVILSKDWVAVKLLKTHSLLSVMMLLVESLRKQPEPVQKFCWRKPNIIVFIVAEVPSKNFRYSNCLSSTHARAGMDSLST